MKGNQIKLFHSVLALFSISKKKNNGTVSYFWSEERKFKKLKFWGRIKWEIAERVITKLWLNNIVKKETKYQKVKIFSILNFSILCWLNFVKVNYLLFLFFLSRDICLNLFQIVFANQFNFPTLAKLNKLKLKAPKK